MKKKLTVFAVLFLVLNALSAQSIDSLPIKKLVLVKRYSYPICKEKKDNCFGYGSPLSGVGPKGKVSALIIQGDSAIVVDSYLMNLVKINLVNGEIIKKSKTFKDEAIGYLFQILYFNKHILLLSQFSTNIYVIDSELYVTDVMKIPLYGYSYKFINFDNTLYALSGKTISYKNKITESVAFKINSDFSLSMDTIKLNFDEYWNDTLLYGEKVHMFENSDKCYLFADSMYYEIPEIIPQFDYYYHAVGYDEKYLVYFVFLETHYEMVVCQYE